MKARKNSFKINKSAVFHRRLDYQYPAIARGKGIYLYDENGKKYIDGVGGALVCNIGHGVKELAEKIGKLAEKTTFLHAAQFTTGHMEDYARKLLKVLPKGLTRSYFVSGGSEAVETAIKLARQYHYDIENKNKYKIIYTWPSYHGATVGALSVTGKSAFRKIAEPYLLKFPSFTGFSSYRCPHKKENKNGCVAECAYEFEKVIKRNNPDTIAALIIEPIVGASAGAILPPKGYFQIIRKICDKYNIILIIDEVMTGFGRTGKWFASEHFGIKPDIMVAGKGISGGFAPLAGVFCTDKIFKAIKNGSGNFSHGFTFANNAFTTGIGNLVLDYMVKNNLVGQAEKMGNYLIAELEKLRKFDIVGDVRGKGLMTAIEFVKDKKTKEPFPRSVHLAEKILQTAQKKGLILYFCLSFVDGANGDAVMVAPPFIVTKKEIDKIVKIFSESIQEVEQSLKN
ncbi:MAG: aminotransferase class III-fold pyridoxal phosphate-dependent enzyme [Patescibacteria group bacterium]|nr:aminotransferase class III-fold pyridoxal phosphate-dependent enzyme [Patescibacteria group bacterium]